MFKLLLFLFLSINLKAFGQGNTVGKGGDTIKCDPSGLNDFRGYYTLDYLLEYNSSEFRIAREIDFEKTVQRLLKYLEDDQPELRDSLITFSQSLYKQDVKSGRIWRKSETPLYDIKDEEIVKRIPENCLVLRNGTYVLELRQTVIRQARPDYIEYNFDQDILSLQKLENPLQYSFFMTHEWLWDFTRNIEALRKLNWLFHSSQLEKMSKDEFRFFLEKTNIGVIDLSVCERSKNIRNLFAKKCEDISKRDLLVIRDLDIDYSSVPPRPGDLYGLSKIKTLKLRGVTSIPPRFFNSLYQLEELDLSSSQLTTISAMTLADLKYLKKLYLNSALSKDPRQLNLIKSTLHQTEIKAIE